MCMHAHVHTHACTSCTSRRIHKSQGMTLDSVELELASCFEPGQAYVALSRAASLQTCRILSFDASRVRAHADVLAFYRDLDERDGAGSMDGAGSGGGANVSNVTSPDVTPPDPLLPPLPPPPRATPAAPLPSSALPQTMTMTMSMTLTEAQRARIAANKAEAVARKEAAAAAAGAARVAVAADSDGKIDGYRAGVCD